MLARHLALLQQVLVQRGDLDHLLTLLAIGEHAAVLPVVQVQLLLGEGGILHTTELAETLQRELTCKERAI
jgi:hypothetical protein